MNMGIILSWFSDRIVQPSIEVTSFWRDARSSGSEFFLAMVGGDFYIVSKVGDVPKSLQG